jgi:hypothetical protein
MLEQWWFWVMIKQLPGNLGKAFWVCALTGLTAGPARKMLRIISNLIRQP